MADVPSHDILLGFDFLSKYGVDVDFGRKEFRIMGKLFPLIVPADLNKPQTVIVPEDTVIPPRSEVIIPGQVDISFAPNCEGMLEPLDTVSTQWDVMIARVVCKVESGRLPIRVINVSKDSLTLRKGMRVGLLHTDIEVGDKAEDVGVEGEDVKDGHLWTVDELITHFGFHQKGLAPGELKSIHDLLQKNMSVFSTGEGDLGRTHLTMHQIDTGDAKPVKLPPRRVPIHLQHEVSEHLKQMLANDIIQPSNSHGQHP